MGITGTTLARGTGHFFAWWLGELSVLVPKQVIAVVQPTDRTIAVTLDETHVTFTRIDGDSMDMLGRFAIESGDYGKESHDLARILASHSPPRWRWGVYLDDTIVLRDLLRLPAAAIENYQEAVEYQIERQTPFNRSDIYFDCRPLPTATSGNLIGIEFVVAPRDIVDSTVRRLTNIGIPVDFITTTADHSVGDKRFNFLPMNRKVRRRLPTRFTPALACLALVLSGLLIYLPMNRDRQTVAALSARLEQAKNETLIASRLREQIEIQHRNVRSVINRKQEISPFTRVFNDLTGLIPDEAWISRLDYKEGTIRAVIHAPESGSIIRLIEESDRFSDARMITAVRRQANTGQERFTLSFSTRGGQKQ